MVRTKFNLFACDASKEGVKLTNRENAVFEFIGEEVEIGGGLLVCDKSSRYRPVDEVEGTIEAVYIYKKVYGNGPEFILARPNSSSKWGNILVGYGMTVGWSMFCPAVLKKEKDK